MTKLIPYTPKQIKTFVIAFVATVSTVGGTVWATLEFMVDPMVEAKVSELMEEEKKNKQSRWETTGKLMGIDGDLVPYELKEIHVKVDSIVSSLERFKNDYQPWLDKWMSRTLLIRYLDDNGDEYMNWRDGRGHPIVEYINGCPWIVYSSQKIYPLPCGQ